MPASSLGTQRLSALDLKDLRERAGVQTLMASEVINTRAMAPKESIEIYLVLKYKKCETRSALRTFVLFGPNVLGIFF